MRLGGSHGHLPWATRRDRGYSCSRPSGRRARPSDRGAAARLFFRNAERGTAATGGDYVRIRDLEAGAHEALGEVDGRTVDVLHARGVHQDPDARDLEDMI